MRQHTRILGLCSALVGLTVAGATSATAATATTRGAAVSKPAGYSIASLTYALPNGAQTFGSVECPKKKGVLTVPLSGGAEISSNSLQANINSSYPFLGGWAVDVNNTSGAASQFTVYAVCANKPTGYKVQESASVSNPAGTDNGAGYKCPNGTVLLGGGALSSADDVSVNLASSWPSGTSIWYMYMDNASTVNETVRLYRVCAKLNVSTTHYQLVAGSTVVNAAGKETNTSAFCPGGLSTIGGGTVSSGDLGVNMNTSFPFVGGWGGDENNASGSNSNLTAYVLCAS